MVHVPVSGLRVRWHGGATKKDKENKHQVQPPCVNSFRKETHPTLTDATKRVKTTNTLEDKPKILEDLGPVSKSVNKEGEIQPVQVPGLVFSNNQLHKHQLEKHWLSRSSAEEDMGLVVNSASVIWLQEKQVLSVMGKSRSLVFLFEPVLAKPQLEGTALHSPS